MIIDFHMHTFPDAIAERTIAKLSHTAKLPPQTNGTIADTIDKMDTWGIDKGVILNIATKPTQQKTINDAAAQINQKYADRLMAFGSVHYAAEDCLEELERIAQMGIKGIKLHPDYQGFMINDPLLYKVYERISLLGLIVVFHAGLDSISPECIHAAPQASAEVADRFPNMKMVLAHMGGNQCWQEVEPFLCGKNVYFDTAFCASMDRQLARSLILKHGADKILLGSDCPWEAADASVRFVESLSLSSADTERILSGNALRLLYQ